MRSVFRFLLRILLFIFIVLNIIVAFQAYKLTRFYNAGSIAVISAAEKTTWDKTQEILFGFNSMKQVNSAPDTIITTVNLYTQDSLKLEAWYMTIPHARGTVALFHGHGGKKSGVLTEAAVFRHLGFNTLLLDFRAHGASTGNTTTIGYYEAEDVKLAYDYLVKNGEKSIILWGISMGAATITKAVHDYFLKPKYIILEMPFGTLLGAVEGRLKMMHLPPEPLSGLLTFWGGVENGFWAYNMKPEEYVQSISCPVLLQWGRHDPRVTEGETQQIFANISTQKKLIVYENSGHESLCKKENEKWQAAVSAFLQ